MVMNNNFLLFKGKRVLVTGHTGFKGSWLALWLTELGAEVAGFALPPLRENDHFNLLGLKDKIQHNEGDICDSKHLTRVVKEFRPHFIFHLAAQALVRPSYDDPKTTFETNVLGSVNLLDAARQITSLKALIFITSDKCYFNKEWVWGYREDDQLGGRDPYSASKAAAELVFASYQDSFFSKNLNLGAASVRAGNVIGGGDWAADRIVPDCIKSLKEGKQINIRSPDATRPWQHVLEPLSGYLLLATKLATEPKHYSSAWNFGPNSSAIKTVEDITNGIILRWGSGKLLVDKPENMPHEANLLHLTIDKAIHHLGWSPRWDFEKTLDYTVNWYKSVLSGESAHEVSCTQIKEYMDWNHD